MYPVTITPARYSGVYEGGKWVAFNLYPEDLPEAAFDDDVTCMTWWSSFDKYVGIGSTPNEALADLKIKSEQKDFDALNRHMGKHVES